MPGLVKRRFEAAEGLFYDASGDTVYLRGGYRGVSPIVGVRKVIMDSDVVHMNDLQVKDEAIVRGGSIIKGNILAEGRVLIEARDSPTVIAGDVGVLPMNGGGEFVVKEGNPVVVLGNILAKSVLIQSPIAVYGNVLALSKAVFKANSLVLGRVTVGSPESPGVLEVEQTLLYHAYAFGDVHFREGVSVIVPLIAARGGKISLKNRVRVLSFPCLFCTQTEDPLACEFYSEGRCPLEERGAGYDYLHNFDLAKSQEYEYLSWFWRASPMMILQNVLAKKLLLLSWRLARSLEVDIEKKVVNGVELSEFPRDLNRKIVKSVRGDVRGALEEVKEHLFATIEEYFKAKGEKYRKCPSCGMPNPEIERICIYCGATI